MSASCASPNASIARCATIAARLTRARDSRSSAFIAPSVPSKSGGPFNAEGRGVEYRFAYRGSGSDKKPPPRRTATRRSRKRPQGRRLARCGLFRPLRSNSRGQQPERAATRAKVHLGERGNHVLGSDCCSWRVRRALRRAAPTAYCARRRRAHRGGRVRNDELGRANGVSQPRPEAAIAGSLRTRRRGTCGRATGARGEAARGGRGAPHRV